MQDTPAKTQVTLHKLSLQMHVDGEAVKTR